MRSYVNAWIRSVCRFAHAAPRALWDEKYRNWGEYTPNGTLEDMEKEMELFNGMKEEWLQYNKTLAGNAAVVALTSPGGDKTFYIHQTSNSGPSKWQLTYLNGNIALGHEIYNTRDDAFKEACNFPGLMKVVVTRGKLAAWIRANCRFAQPTPQRMTGYKAMKYENGFLISGADSRVRFKPVVGQEIRFPGKGLYLSLSKSYVEAYYTGLHDKEAIITLSFDPKDITFGNTTDRETEIAVSKAILVAVEEVAV